MQHAAKKKFESVTTKQATIYLLEGPTTIKLPVPANAVRKLQAALEKEFAKNPLKVASE